MKGIPDVARHAPVTVTECSDTDNFPYPEVNKIILDECSTVVEIDHVRNSKTTKMGKMDDIWLEFIRL